MPKSLHRRFAVLSLSPMVLLCVALSVNAEDKTASKQPAITLESAITLRKAGKHQAALELLKKLESKKDLKAETRQAIPLERALVYQQRRSTRTRSEDLMKDVALALKSVDRFLKQSPRHKRRQEALTAKGKLLLHRARTLAERAENEVVKKRAEDFRAAGLKDIPEARKVLRELRDTLQTKYKAFPRFIPPANKALLRERNVVEAGLMQAKLNLAMVTHEEAMLSTGGKEDRDELLKQAAGEFETIHRTYRTQVGGLYARMWQGKCLQEMGQIGKALGIYNELRSHPSRNRFYVTILKPTALSFTLMCLNDKQRKDHILAIAFAEKWLKNNKKLHNTRAGHRIRWELAVAHERASRKAGVNEKKVKAHRKAALDTAKALRARSSVFRSAADAMIKRLGDPEDPEPKNFEQAWAKARTEYARFSKVSSQLAASRTGKKSAVEIQRIEAEKLRLGDQAAERLRQAIKLAGKRDVAKRNQARLLLAFVELKRGHLTDSQKLGLQAAREAHKTDSPTSRQAAFIAFAACFARFKAAKPKHRPGIAKELAGIAKFLEKNWPDTKHTKDARRTMQKVKTLLP